MVYFYMGIFVALSGLVAALLSRGLQMDSDTLIIVAIFMFIPALFFLFMGYKEVKKVGWQMPIIGIFGRKSGEMPKQNWWRKILSRFRPNQRS